MNNKKYKKLAEQVASKSNVLKDCLCAFLVGGAICALVQILLEKTAGTLVPITGFANACASAAIEFKTEGRILGTGANIFKISGPVIVFGLLAGWVYGVIYYIFIFI